MEQKIQAALSQFKRITRVGLIAIFLLGVILFTLLTVFKSPFSIVDIMAYLTGSVAIVTLIHFSKSLDQANTHNQNMLELSKNQYSFDVVAEAHKDNIKKSLNRLRQIEKSLNLSTIDTSKLMEYFGNNPEEEEEVVQVLNFFEHLSILIYRDQVSELIIKDSFKTLFIRTRVLFNGYMEYIHLNRSNTIWSNYITIATKWQSE